MCQHSLASAMPFCLHRFTRLPSSNSLKMLFQSRARALAGAHKNPASSFRLPDMTRRRQRRRQRPRSLAVRCLGSGLLAARCSSCDLSHAAADMYLCMASACVCTIVRAAPVCVGPCALCAQCVWDVAAACASRRNMSNTSVCVCVCVIYFVYTWSLSDRRRRRRRHPTHWRNSGAYTQQQQQQHSAEATTLLAHKRATTANTEFSHSWHVCVCVWMCTRAHDTWSHARSIAICVRHALQARIFSSTPSLLCRMFAATMTTTPSRTTSTRQPRRACTTDTA